MSSAIDSPPPYVGHGLRVVWLWTWETIMDAVTRAGHDDITAAHAGLFRYPGLDGYRLTDIARRMQVTKQSVHQSLGQLEKLGYLVREPDPTSRRSRLVRLTPKGHALQETIRLAARDADRRLVAMLGEPDGTRFKESLRRLVDEIAADGIDAGVNPPGRG